MSHPTTGRNPDMRGYRGFKSFLEKQLKQESAGV